MINLPKSAYDKQSFWPRFVALGLLCLLLFNTGLLVMASYAPLAVAFLLFGQTWGAILSIVCLATVGILAPISGGSFVLLFGLVPIVILGAIVAYLIKRGISPQKTVVCSILFFIGLTIFFGGISMVGEGLSFYQFADKMIDAVVTNLQLDSNPEAKSLKIQLTEGNLFGVKIKYMLPAVVCVVGAFQVWLGMYFIMLFAHAWRRGIGYKHSMKSFLNYRNSEYLVIPFILSLAGYLLGHYMKMEILTVFTGNLLFVLGFFYFLHGFGVYLDFLKFVKLRGFVKGVFVVIGFIFLTRLLAIIGVFDLWVNFRKFLQNKIES